MRTLRCSIEQLVGWHPHLFLEPHIVASVAVLSRYSESPAEIHVDCADIGSDWVGEAAAFRMDVAWTGATLRKADRLRKTVQGRPILEMAATALALILGYHVLRLGQIDVTQHGERADYRSIDRSAVLEISGTESISQLSRRHREKVRQALANPFGWDAFVVVCAFSSRGHRVRLSHHPSPGEVTNG